MINVVRVLLHILMFAICFQLGYRKALKEAYSVQETLRDMAVRSNESGVQVQDEVQDV